MSMSHIWNNQTDGNSSTVRVVMSDFKKAFDPIKGSLMSFSSFFFYKKTMLMNP